MLGKLSFEEIDISKLRFGGGDVIFYLSDEKEDIAVIPKAFLTAQLKWFEASLRWRKAEVRHGATIPIYRYGLIYDPLISTWTLESMKEDHEVVNDKWFSMPDEGYILHTYAMRTPCRNRDLGFEDVDYSYAAHREAIIPHKMLFALLLNQPVELELLEIDDLSIQVANFISLREYYQLTESLKVKCEGLLRRNIHLDCEIARMPAFYLGISEILRSRFVYAEATRHFVGLANRIKSKMAKRAHTCATISAATKDLARTKTIELQRNLEKLKYDLFFLINGTDGPSPTFTSRP